MLKGWLLTDDAKLYHAYEDAVEGIKKHLLRRSSEGRLYCGQREHGRHTPYQDELSCFLPGTLALGSVYGRHEDLPIAEELVQTCVYLAEAQPSGLLPEAVIFPSKGEGHGNGGSLDFLVKKHEYILR